jgi:hypothetical protein
METATKITQSDLVQFSGTENYYRHAINRRVTFTDGMKFLADKAGAYWLLDEIALRQSHPRLKGECFQVWRLKLDGKGCTLTADDGNDNVLLTKAIECTDFPLDEIRLYVCEGGPGNTKVIMLPGEY